MEANERPRYCYCCRLSFSPPLCSQHDPLPTPLRHVCLSAAFARAVEEARSRQQSLNPRSHTLIAKFEGEVRAKAERAKVEEERVAREAEEAKAKKAEEEEEKAELKAKEAAAEEKARLKEEEENKAKEKEEATTELAGDAGVPSPEGGAEQDVSGNNAEAAAEAQDVDTKR